MSITTRRIIPAIAIAGTMMLVSTGCVAGENAAATDAKPTSGTTEWSSDTLSIDFATYNPLSLVIRDQGILEDIRR